MAMLAALQSPPQLGSILSLALKFGVGPVLAVMLTLFLMQRVSADQLRTLDALTQHQEQSQAALRDQLEMLRIICANLAPNEAQRTLCLGVGR